MTRIPETKEDLKRKIEELEEKIETLENDVNYWQAEYDDVEEERDKLQEQLDNVVEYEGVKDINNFIYKLKLDNLYTEELERFINYYLRYHND